MMFKHNPDYKSRFRILKGGKISLVVSTLLVSSSMITPANADTVVIATATTSEYTLNQFDDLEITSTGSITTIDANGVVANILNTNIINNNDIVVNPISGATRGILVETSMNGHIINNATALIDVHGNTGRAFGIQIGTMVADSTLTNSGTIQADAGAGANGVYVSDVTYGTITNNIGGTISAESTGQTASAVYFNREMGTGSALVNSGLIKAVSIDSYARGINFDDNFVGTITNNAGGEISATSTSGSALGVNLYFGAATGSQLNNSGSITAVSTNGEAYGVVLNAQMRGTITNNVGGIISAHSTDGEASGVTFWQGMEAGSALINSGTIEAVSATTYAYGLRFGTWVHGTITNNAGGIISAQSTNQVAKAIMTDYSLEADSALINSGTIQAVSTDTHAYALYLGDVVNGTITNNVGGSISAESTDGKAEAVYFSSGMGADSQLTNSGTINAVSTTSHAYGIYFQNTMAGSITNNIAGEISANSTADDAFGFVNRRGMSADASLVNNGTIEGKVNGELDRFGYSLYVTGFNAGTIHNTATGKLYGNIYISGTQTFTNDGLISLPHNAIMTETAYIKNFHQTSEGTLEIALMSDSEGMAHSKFYSETALFEAGSTIAVNVLTAPNDQALIVGSTLTDVIGAADTLTVEGTLNVTDNSALLNFEYVVDGDTIDLNIIQGHDDSGNDVTIESSTINGSGNKNAQSSARALQAINDDAANHPAMSDYIVALNTLGTDTEVAQAVASTTPVAATAAVGSTTQIMNGVQGIVEMRQNTTMGTGMNSGDIALRDQNLWIKPFGSRGTQDNKDGMNGFEVKAYGFGMGYDAEVSPKQRLGAAFFYTDADVDVKGMAQSSDVKVYTTLLYGNMPINANTDFLFQAAYSFQKTESERVILPTYDRATADFTAKTASLDLKLMQTYAIDKDFIVRPRVETTYRHYTNPSYAESGAGAMNLEVEKFTSTQFITGAGMIAEYKMDKESKLITDLRLGYDWHHDSQTVTASYQGATGVDFTTNGIDNGGWQYDIGLGYETANVLGGEISFMYNYQGQGNSFDNHVLSAKYVYKF